MTDSAPPTLLWLRRDLRLSDHPGWHAALSAGGPVIPVFVLDPLIERDWGAAPLWRLGESLAALSRSLGARGSRLILRRGEACETLKSLASETGARRVVWSRLHEPDRAAEDRKVASALRSDGIEAEAVDGFLLHEPEGVETSDGGHYRVFTPFWRAIRSIEIPEPHPAPRSLAPPDAWPERDALPDWCLGRAMRRGADIVSRHAVVGEDAAEGRLGAFVANSLGRYGSERDRLDRDATSGLSENLTYGEISPRRIWHAALAAEERDPSAARSAEAFRRELAWREFAWHLLHHAPHLTRRAWREEWDDFPWRPDNPDAERWRRGMTGVAVLDAAMRQLYVTGTMHNRARMIVASFLTKHLLTHWKVGADWFRDCLIDWDPASNALGWQWVAGSGPDAAPYFRIFNPETQAKKFDPEGHYRSRFLAEGRRWPHDDAVAFFEAAPASWNLDPVQRAPHPIVDLAEGRARALEVWQEFRDRN